MDISDFLPVYSFPDGDMKFFSYPEGDEFYVSTAKKKEFSDLKLTDKNQELIPGQFKPLNNQLFAARFMSPYTPNNVLLVFQEVGTGKCVTGDTMIQVNLESLSIKSMWDDYHTTSFSRDEGEFSKPSKLLLAQTYKNGKLSFSKINYLYRQKIQEIIFRFETDDGETIRCTGEHKLLVNGLWKKAKDICFLDKLALTYLGVVFQKNIKNITSELCFDYVYDLEVEFTHNYIANNFITHNTCLASLVSENIRKENPYYDTTLFITRNETLKKNTMNEIAYICTNGKYLPENESLSQEAYQKRLNVNLKRSFVFETLEKFAKDVNKLTSEMIEKRYSNRVIIVDEFHNIQQQPIPKEDDVYTSMFRFFHTVKNCKIVLLSATFMVDTPDEICARLNLVNPLNMQLDRKTFYNNFFNQNAELKSDKKDILKSYMKGKISYVRATGNNKKNYNGQIVGDMKKMPLIPLILKDHQRSYYEKAELLDAGGTKIDKIEEEEDEKHGLYSNTRQALLFVAPDGSYGNELYENNWIDKNGNITNKLKNALSTNGSPDISKLEEYSIKYAKIIRFLKDNPTKKVFIYINRVSGSGCNLFASILTFFGFFQARKEKVLKPTPDSFIFINSKNFNTSVQLINNVYNSDQNVNGKYIRIILASKLASEGLSCKHTTVFIGVTPGWNETELSQAQGRIDRAFALDLLPENERVINIYRYVAFPEEGKGLDYRMYKIMEDKDFPIKQIERLMKESAVDCYNNRGRNIRSNEIPNTRECDYQECNYSCDGIPDEKYMNSYPTIIDSYNLYYAEDDISFLKVEIKKLFNTKFIYTIKDLKNIFNKFPLVVLIRSLKSMIDSYEPLTNAYGLISYLAEESDFYFLVSEKNSQSKFSMLYYCTHPQLIYNTSSEDLVIEVEHMFMPDKIEYLYTLKDDYEEVSTFLQFFSLQTQEEFLELFLFKNDWLSSFIKKLYGEYIVDTGKLFVSKLLYKKYDIIRCSNKDEMNWRNCSKEDIKYETAKEEKFNPYGYTGIIKNKEFKIKKVWDVIPLTKAGKPDMRKINQEGTKCGTGNNSYGANRIKGLLLSFDMLSEKYKQSPPVINPANKLEATPERVKDLYNDWKEKVFESKEYPYTAGPDIKLSDIDNFPKERLIRWKSILEQSGANICGSLKDFFADKNLLKTII